MKTLLTVLLRLFPNWWRRRYEEEFRAMFDDVRFRGSDCADILKLVVEVRMSGPSGLSLWKLMLLLASVGAVVGAAATVFWPATYQSSAVIRMKAGNRSVSAGELAESAWNDDALDRVMHSTGFPVDSTNDTAERIARFRRNIHVTAVGKEHNALLVQYVAPEPEVAQRVVAALVDVLRGALRNSEDAEVIDPASLDPAPVSPNVRNVVVTGALAGALCGLILTVLAAKFRRQLPMRPA